MGDKKILPLMPLHYHFVYVYTKKEKEKKKSSTRTGQDSNPRPLEVWARGLTTGPENAVFEPENCKISTLHAQTNSW